MKKTIKVVGMNLLFLLLLLAVSDILLWVIAPVPNPRLSKTIENAYIPSSFSPGQKLTFISEEGLSDLDSVIHFSTNNVGFRGDHLKDPKPEDEYRIFLVGGSTTECLYIDDEKSIEKQLQKNLNASLGIELAKVYNAGKSGDISTDHLAMIAHRINHLEPDLIILFAGLNDFRRNLFGYEYVQMPYEAEYSIMTPVLDVCTAFSQLARRLTIAKRQIYKQIGLEFDWEAITRKTRYQEFFDHAKTLPVSNTLPEYSSQSYETNIRSIIGMCEANEIPLVLVTQATTWDSKVSSTIRNNHWMTVSPDNERFDEKAMEQGLDDFNEVLRKLSAEKKGHLLDLARQIPKSEAYFYDDCHFNNNGVQYFSRLLSSFIMEQDLISGSSRDDNFMLHSDMPPSQ